MNKPGLDIISVLTNELQLSISQVTGTIHLLEEGSTVPFIARYRKEQTGNLDETQIRKLQQKFTYLKEIEERRQTILKQIQAQGKLTEELNNRIQNTTSKTELEDLYLPFKPKRATRASKARDAGLEPLSKWLLDLESPSEDLQNKALEFLNNDKGIDSPEKALQGACDILAEEIAADPEARKALRRLALKKGHIKTTVKKAFASQKTKYQMYYDYEEQANSIVSHRYLAMIRGEKEKVLSLNLDFPKEKDLSSITLKWIKHPNSAASPLLRKTVEDSFDRLLFPATETEVRKTLYKSAEEEACEVFGQNLKELLLSPPAGNKPVLGVDPGFRSGCKVASLDKNGAFLEYQTIFPNEPHKKEKEAGRTILDLISKYGIDLIAIGNGTASRETERFIKDILSDLPENTRPLSLIISESGASVYSVSEVAQKEFPDFDATVRGAISIGRRLQDPLSELVKIDPRSIGVGQYQHDISQSALKLTLENIVEHCVNLVGVDLNSASEALLKYVSGLNTRIAEKIIAHRKIFGPFKSRKELRNVPSLGNKTFEQSAGFLRIPDAKNPLDNSAVHPERYGFVKRLASDLETTVDKLIGNASALRTIDRERLI